MSTHTLTHSHTHTVSGNVLHALTVDPSERTIVYGYNLMSVTKRMTSVMSDAVGMTHAW
jgi:hypothetical protein